MVTFLIVAILAVLPIGLLVAFARGSGKGSYEKFLVVGLFVIMAFFLYKSLSADRSLEVDPEQVGPNIEYVQTNEPSKVEPASESNAFRTVFEGTIFDTEEFDSIIEIGFIGLTAFLPAVIYLLYFVAFDDKKPEPFHVLLLAVLVGSVIAVVVWMKGFSLYNSGLSIKADYSLTESINIGFLKIALPSEVIKWIFLLLFLRLNKYYDEYIDGIVYSICLSMGFASIMYVGFMLHYVAYPTSTLILLGIVTALILIPIYMMSGAIMGYFVALTKWRNKFLNYVLSLVVPVFVSGMLFSVMALIADNWWYYVFFIIILPIITCIVYRQIGHLMELEREKSK